MGLAGAPTQHPPSWCLAQSVLEKFDIPVPAAPTFDSKPGESSSNGKYTGMALAAGVFYKADVQISWVYRLYRTRLKSSGVFQPVLDNNFQSSLVVFIGGHEN